MKDIIEVEITREDIIASYGYMDNENCPLAIAVKKIIPNKRIRVGSDYVRIRELNDNFLQDGIIYTFDNSLWGKNEREMPQFIKSIKAGGDFQPIKLTLTLQKNG